MLESYKKYYQEGKSFPQKEMFEESSIKYRQLLERMDEQEDSKMSHDSIALS